jgi:YihY family inner membrane protein
VNPVERGVRQLDRFQQRSRNLGFIFGVVKKFGDDRGSSLAALLAYYGFMSLFPLLLVLTTILGFIGNATIKNSIIGETLKQFPVYGEQIGTNATHPLTGNLAGLIFGLLVLLYGSMGVTQASQHAMAQIWNVPGVVRPGYFPRMARGLLLFVTLGLAMAITAGVSGVATISGRGFWFRVLLLLVEGALNIALYFAIFRVLTPAEVATRHLAPGSILGGIGYSVLLTVGTTLVQHNLRHAQALYGHYAFVLGIISWLYLVALISLYAAETNVVLSRRLWPRSIVQPPLTKADERVLGDIARQEVRRVEQQVRVGWRSSGRKEPERTRPGRRDGSGPSAVDP